MKNFLRSLFLICGILFLISCGGGGGSSGVPVGSLAPSNFLVNAPSLLTLEVGQGIQYQISGGSSPYIANSTSNGIVAAIVNSSVLTLGGNAVGSATVSISPSGGGARQEIQVTVVSSVKPLTLISSADVTIAPGAEQRITISGGAAPYVTSSSNSQIVMAEVSGQTLVLKAPSGASGTAVVTVSDKNGATTSLNVTAGFTVQPLTLAMTDMKLPVGLPGGARVRIIGGIPPYRVTPGIPAALDAKIVSSVDSFGVTVYEVEITPKLASKLDVAVVDSANQTAKVNVEIGVETTSIRLSPSALTLSDGSTETIRINVFGAVGDIGAINKYTTATSKMTLTLGEDVVSGIKYLDVKLNADPGTLNDASQICQATPSATITVIDANRSVGTAVLTFTPTKRYVAPVAPATTGTCV